MGKGASNREMLILNIGDISVKLLCEDCSLGTILMSFYLKAKKNLTY